MSLGASESPGYARLARSSMRSTSWYPSRKNRSWREMERRDEVTVV